MTYWLKNEILTHFKFTKGNKVRIYRDFLNDRVVIDYFGGSCTKYSYSGKWICG